MGTRQIDVLDMLNIFSIMIQMSEYDNQIDIEGYFKTIIENQNKILTLLENNQ